MNVEELEETIRRLEKEPAKNRNEIYILNQKQLLFYKKAKKSHHKYSELIVKEYEKYYENIFDETLQQYILFLNLYIHLTNVGNPEEIQSIREKLTKLKSIMDELISETPHFKNKISF
jgi:hypothetical protein